MGHNEELLKNVREVVERINDLRDLAYAQYLPAVDEVLAGRITDKSQIEHILDGILDFGDDPRFLDLSKRLCRYLYYEYPQLVVDFISMYRLLFDEKGDSDGTSANHGESPQGDL